MGYSQNALDLRKLRTIELPRLSDRISYLYFDRTRIIQDRTGVIAIQESDGATRIIRIPIASIGFLLLGPGTSISAPAAISLHRAGTVVMFTSEGGVTGFAMARPLTGRADWMQAQARCWVNPEARLLAAKKLYARQFNDENIDPEIPLRVLRGIEGSRVKTLYQNLSKKHHLKAWRRETDPEKYTDPVNPLLNLGSAILYGAALTAVGALGLTPSLGFIHNGASNALFFDLADIYKTHSSIPLAFSCSQYPDGSARLRTEMRRYLFEHNVMEAMLDLLVDILFDYLEPAENRRGDKLTDESGFVDGHTNYGHVDSGLKE